MRDDQSVFNQPISLDVDSGEIVVIMGTSGVGKTTLLDCIRGSVAHTGAISGVDSVFSVHQGDNQLFPWYTVRQNFELAQCNASWQEICKKWRIDHLVDRRPGEMSGGQRQRFVLLRALCRGADLLLCDEPLNHLDMLSSKIIAKDFKKTLKNTGTTTIWITHDIIEAQILSDRCYILTGQGLVSIDHQDINIDHVSELLVT